MSTARVASVAPGSHAEFAGVIAGDELLSVNGSVLRDVIRYQLEIDEPEVELELRRGGVERTLQITKPAGSPIGLELDSAVFDQVRTCDNHCPFCFIHQLPTGMRKSLSLKDDDYRLSFLYGNFTTLTRFTEIDLERVIDEQLSPLYVSIHATDPDVRTVLLRNRRGATSLRWLELLLDAGIEIHGQVVVCPGINDGSVLDDTMLGILDRFPRLATLGVVPLGVSAHNREPEMRPHTRDEAIAVLETIDRWQSRFQSVLGRRLAFASDEYYLLASRPFPTLAEYDGCAQHENGIGMAATFAAEVDAVLRGEAIDAVGTRAGFFAWVDGARPDGYRVSTSSVPAVPPSAVAGRTSRSPVTIVTGEMGAAVLAPVVELLRKYVDVPVSTLAVRNEFFGGNIGVTGLLVAADVERAVAAVPSNHRVLIPDVLLSRGRFLDGGAVADLSRTVEIVATTGTALVEAVCR